MEIMLFYTLLLLDLSVLWCVYLHFLFPVTQGLVCLLTHFTFIFVPSVSVRLLMVYLSELLPVHSHKLEACIFSLYMNGD